MPHTLARAVLDTLTHLPRGSRSCSAPPPAAWTAPCRTAWRAGWPVCGAQQRDVGRGRCGARERGSKETGRGRGSCPGWGLRGSHNCWSGHVHGMRTGRSVTLVTRPPRTPPSGDTAAPSNRGPRERRSGAPPQPFCAHLWQLPTSVSSTLCGLMSLCTMPRSCSAPRPRHTSSMVSRQLQGGGEGAGEGQLLGEVA